MNEIDLKSFCCGIEHGIEYSGMDIYYGGNLAADVSIEPMSKAIRISGIKEDPIDLYIQELIAELQSQMLTSKFKQKAIKIALEQISKSKGAGWWGDLTDSEIESLVSKVKGIYSGQKMMLSDGLKTAYICGKLNDILDETTSLKKARKLIASYKQSPIDQAAIKHIDNTANLFWDKAISREIDPIKIRILQNNRDATTGVLKNYFKNPKKSWRSVSSDIYHSIEKSHRVTLRDIDRITLTEISSAQNTGILFSHHERGQKEYFVIVRPTACKICKDMYLNVDGTPKRFNVAEHLLIPRDANWGVRKGDKRIPQSPPAHPHCFCRVSS